MCQDKYTFKLYSHPELGKIFTLRGSYWNKKLDLKRAHASHLRVTLGLLLFDFDVGQTFLLLIFQMSVYSWILNEI